VRQDPIEKSFHSQEPIVPLQQAQMAPHLGMMHPHLVCYAPVPPHIYHMPDSPYLYQFMQQIMPPPDSYGQYAAPANNMMKAKAISNDPNITTTKKYDKPLPFNSNGQNNNKY